MEIGGNNAILIAELAKDMGLESLVFDEEGKIVFGIGEELVVAIVARDNEDYLTLHARLADNAVQQPALMRLALEGNFAWRKTAGACLAIDPALGALVIHQKIATGESTFDQFVAALETFVRTAQAWKFDVEQVSDTDQEAAVEPSKLLQYLDTRA